jgi:hypothetical protein
MVNPSVTSFTLDPEQCRQSLAAFWSEQLTIERDGNGLVLALPLMLPDGVQIAVELHPVSERRAILSDAGDALRWLVGHGLNIKSDANKQWIDERLAAFELSRSGFEIFRDISLPIQGIDVHVFGEALVSIAHLICRHEEQQAAAVTADDQVVRILTELHVPFKKRASLRGFIEDTIEVDYFWERTAPTALQVLHKTGTVLDTMERWGWRWRDLKRQSSNLRAAMIYDPDRQAIDPTSRRIGEEVCELFCAYHEADRIAEFVNA